MKKILIANRGEIARRIIRTTQAMGIQSVAVYAPDEAHALHVQEADEAYPLNGHTLSETYLNKEQLIAVAKNSGADAIHPGYGFLSENADFSKAVTQAGLTFIGPSPQAIHQMGNKLQASAIASSLDIPLIENVKGSLAELKTQQEALPYPLLVKAAAGGGGKGMRIVRQPAEFVEALETTAREAQNYFGNGDVYVERYIENPRHIEVQILADTQGNVIHLFERECSIQRRHQKIVE